MNRWIRKAGILIAAAVAIGGAAPARAALPVVLPRPGQIGFTLQGEFATLFDSGNLGAHFGSGGGIAARMRYRMRYDRALGLSFEAHTLDARDANGWMTPPDTLPAFARTRLSVLLSGVDLYQMFNTEERTQEMVSVGAGLAQVHYSLRDGETEYPSEGDGVYVALGTGLERFFYRSLAFDLSARYTAIFHGGKTNQGVQAAAGAIFYASY